MYKQVKTGWRLVAFRANILSVLTISKTCRENRELHNEVSLWKYLCQRDFGSGENLRDYIDRYQFGTRYYNSTTKLDVSHELPRNIFTSASDFIVTYTPVITSEIPHPNTIRHSLCAKSTVYIVDYEKRTVRPNDNSFVQRILLQPLIRWIGEHFIAETYLFRRGYVIWHGRLRSGRVLIIGNRKFDSDAKVEYKLDYNTRKLTYKDVELFLYEEGVEMKPPNLVI